MGKEVLNVIDREPKIKSPEKDAVEKIDIGAGISFRDVEFRYPTAPDHVKDVFSGASFMVKAG